MLTIREFDLETAFIRGRESTDARAVDHFGTVGTQIFERRMSNQIRKPLFRITDRSVTRASEQRGFCEFDCIVCRNLINAAIEYREDKHRPKTFDGFVALSACGQPHRESDGFLKFFLPAPVTSELDSRQNTRDRQPIHDAQVAVPQQCSRVAKYPAGA